jgi:hypothetical protein
MCHSLKHLGLLQKRAADNEIDIEEYISHFCKVNVVDRLVYEEHLQEAMRLFEERSHYHWLVYIPEWLYPYAVDDVPDIVLFSGS